MSKQQTMTKKEMVAVKIRRSFLEEVEKKGKLELVSTCLSGVALKIKSRIKIELPLKELERFLRLAKKYCRLDFQIKKLAKEQEKLREPIIALVAGHKELRGILSEDDGLSLTVSPRKTITWDIGLLKKSLGKAESVVIQYDLLAHISIPGRLVTAKGLVSEKTLREAIDNALTDLGIGAEDLDKIRFLETKPRIDEEKLAEMIKRGQVKLLKNTKSSVITWTITPEKLK